VARHVRLWYLGESRATSKKIAGNSAFAYEVPGSRLVLHRQKPRSANPLRYAD
jgi:hypothetical protein